MNNPSWMKLGRAAMTAAVRKTKHLDGRARTRVRLRFRSGVLTNNSHVLSYTAGERRYAVT